MNLTTDLSEEINTFLPQDSIEEVDGDQEHGYIGFIESSLLKIIPKFFKAIATLLISGLLLGVTFLLINLWKRGCRTHRKLGDDTKAKHGAACTPLHSVVVTPPTEDTSSTLEDSRSDLPTMSSLQPVRSKYMKVPKQTYLRRASGPFGSEVLSFVGEQYTMKNIGKELKESNHHHHGHHHHIHSGASSTGGGSIQNENVPEASVSTKSKWNCFKSGESEADEK